MLLLGHPLVNPIGSPRRLDQLTPEHDDLLLRLQHLQGQDPFLGAQSDRPFCLKGRLLCLQGLLVLLSEGRGRCLALYQQDVRHCKLPLRSGCPLGRLEPGHPGSLQILSELRNQP